jgi:hypothetical protein
MASYPQIQMIYTTWRTSKVNNNLLHVLPSVRETRISPIQKSVISLKLLAHFHVENCRVPLFIFAHFGSIVLFLLNLDREQTNPSPKIKMVVPVIIENVIVYFKLSFHNLHIWIHSCDDPILSPLPPQPHHRRFLLQRHLDDAHQSKSKKNKIPA